MSKAIQLAPICDLAAILDGQLVALNVSHDGKIYAVVARGLLDYREERKDGVSFAKTTPSQLQSYRVVTLGGNEIFRDVTVEGERFNIHDVQPLPNGELLLVCNRCHRRAFDDIEKNGRIYDSDGVFRREILLGDGIQRTQATAEGIVWTSYFDEGVFGNFGWNEPVGAAGLVAWDAFGNKIYEYRPPNGLDTICDCYAMNVASETSTWIYYYTEFPLVHLRRQKIEGHWSIPIRGSDAFAVGRGLALFRGGYEARDNYYLFELAHAGTVRSIVKFSLNDEKGEAIVADEVVGRSESLYIRQGLRIFRYDVINAADAFA
ncbi:MAG TPA: hypothetical protein VHM90_04855 [Phycisphaerae bacterium]|jgi:hypothetical protein|nr:hypothetical protein [Phycisphaerae bacterium]